MEWLSDLLVLVVRLVQISAGLMLFGGAYLAISQIVEERAAPGRHPAKRGTALADRPFRVA